MRKKIVLVFLVLSSFLLFRDCNAEVKTKKSYYKDRKVKIEMPYKDGKKEGVAKLYDEDGRLIAETPYKNNKIEGLAKNYDKRGSVISDSDIHSK